MREPEAIEKEDFASGSASAIAGGVCSYLDMPCYLSPPTTTVGALSEKERLASAKSFCDFGFHFGATEKNLELIKKLQPPSLKAFLAETNSPLTLSEFELEKHFAFYFKYFPILVHCEDQKIIKKNKKIYREHHKIRSIEAALSAVKKVNRLARKYKRRVHFCHLSSAIEVKTAKSGNKKFPKDADILYPNYMSCEVATHHLFLSIKDIKRFGNFANVNPPLRSEKEVAKLWKKLKIVDCVVSDHAPHTLEEKEKGAFGFAGVQTLVPLMMDAVLNKKLSLKDAVRLFSSGPARVFNIYNKGEIAKNYFADFIIFDPKAKWLIKEEDLYSKADWSPYLGKELKGRVIGTMVRGQMAYWEGKILVKEGYGKPLIRTKKIGQLPLFLKKHSKEI
ncbi:MAG: dihydroorotase, partial [Candidatus Anstonellaceae archaeon]